MLNKIKSIFSSRPAKVELWQSSKNSKFYFHTRASNGKVFDPSQGYTTKSNASRAARKRELEVVEIEDPNSL